MYENNMYNKEMKIKEGDKIYFKKHPAIIVGMRQANGMKVKNLEKKYGKIEQIQRPCFYNRIYENKEILDDAEKRYLKAVIRPFKGKVEFIRKIADYSYFEREFIQIKLLADEDINLPYFRAESMYRGMEVNKNYTVKELGLYE